MAIDTVVSGDSLDVVGPPPSVTVNVDVGPRGNRGSIFFSGYGAPNPLLILGSQLGDLYINRELGASYGMVYILSAVPGGISWESILKFQPNAYSNYFTVDFVSGSGSLTIPLTDFYKDAPNDLTESTVIIQATAEFEDPVLLSISDKTLVPIEDTEDKNLVINFEAASFSSGSLSALSESITLNIFITLGDGE